MRQFNLEEAKAGKPVCTKNGLQVRIICFDRLANKFPIVALVKDFSHLEIVREYTIEGNFYVHAEDGDEYDLMMCD